MLAVFLALAFLTNPSSGQKRRQTGLHSIVNGEESRPTLQVETSNPSAALGMLLLASNPAVGYQNIGMGHDLHNQKHAGSRSGLPVLIQSSLGRFVANYHASHNLESELEEIEDSAMEGLVEEFMKNDTLKAELQRAGVAKPVKAAHEAQRRLAVSKGRDSSDAKRPAANGERGNSDATIKHNISKRHPLADLQVDMEIEGKAARVESYGVFVNIGSRRTAFLPMEIPNGSLPIEVGDTVKSRIKAIDYEERWVTLTQEDTPKATPLKRLKVDMEVKGQVVYAHPFGAFVDIGAEEDALIHFSEIAEKSAHIEKGDTIIGRIKKVDLEKKIILLTYEEEGCPEDWLHLVKAP